MQMIDRMRNLFTDNGYMSPEKSKLMENGPFEPNINAFTLVIKSVNHLYKNIQEIANLLIEGQIKNRKMNLKYYYISCAKLFLIDTFLWGAIFSDHDEIFYQDMDTSP